MVKKQMSTQLPLLKHLNANMISGFSLALSLIAYLLIAERAILASVVALFFVMLLDALDGIVARAKDQTSSNGGWVVDVSVDRVSEAVISLALSRVFILFTILNMGLALLSCHYKKHAIIPLRHAILVVLMACLVLESQPALSFAVSFIEKILFQW
jgi:phosphatidylglycerophosphate synthase